MIPVPAPLSRQAAGTGGRSGAAITTSTAIGVAPARMLTSARRLRSGSGAGPFAPPFSAAVAIAVEVRAARNSDTRGDVKARTSVAGTSAAKRTTADHSTRRTGWAMIWSWYQVEKQVARAIPPSRRGAPMFNEGKWAAPNQIGTRKKRTF